ncbi:MAG: hypothetical protein QM679_03965 [Patulibacter sp.]
MSDRQPPTPRQHEPDIAIWLVLIALACITTMGELALVVEAPTIVVWVAALLPVFFWALLLRQVHRFLRDGQPDDAPSWTESGKRFLHRRRVRRHARNSPPR